MAKETREFVADKDHLRNTVLRQAGSLWKGLLEGVMNSVDAGATYCDIGLTEKAAWIEDDGRGFQSREEIIKNFETFGTPHVEGDATYGEFRMGRGQLFAFGANTWRTGKYLMETDVKKNGLKYELSTAPLHKGCRIDIKLYEKLLPSTLFEAEEEMTKYVKYVSIPIRLNGKRISTDPAKEKWDHTLDGAYLRLKESAYEMRVYNLGVFVCGIPSGQLGCGGEVVSRERLKLNFARNDVMRSGHEKCPIWAKVAPLMKKKVRDEIAKKPSLTQYNRQALLIALAGGEKIDNPFKAELWQTSSGRNYSFEQLIRAREEYPVACQGQRNDHRGDKVMQMKLGFCFASDLLETFHCKKTKEFLLKLDEIYNRHLTGYRASSVEKRFQTWPVKTLTELDGELDKKHKLLDDKDLKPMELAVLLTMRKAEDRMRYYLGKTHSKQPRRIVLGESLSYNGWTDGASYIAVSRKFLGKYPSSLALWAQLGHLLIHEYNHDDHSHVTHVHSPEFYERYHDDVKSGAIGAFVDCAIEKFADCARQAEAKLNRYKVKRLDHLAINKGIENRLKKAAG